MSDTADHAAVRSATRRPFRMALDLSASAQLRNMATIGGNVLQRTRCVYFRDVSQPCNKRQPGSGCSAIGGDDRKMAILGANDRCIAVHPSDFCGGACCWSTRRSTCAVRPANARCRSWAFTGCPTIRPAIRTFGPGELITAVASCRAALTRNSTYLKVRDRASYEFALVSVAAALDVSGGTIRDARDRAGRRRPCAVARARSRGGADRRAPSRDLFAAAADAELRRRHAAAAQRLQDPLARNAMIRALATRRRCGMIGAPVERVDGRAESHRRRALPRMKSQSANVAYGVIVTSTIAAGRVTSIDAPRRARCAAF